MLQLLVKKWEFKSITKLKFLWSCDWVLIVSYVRSVVLWWLNVIKYSSTTSYVDSDLLSLRNAGLLLRRLTTRKIFTSVEIDYCSLLTYDSRFSRKFNFDYVLKNYDTVSRCRWLLTTRLHSAIIQNITI
jgi:hypothetical protein